MLVAAGLVHVVHAAHVEARQHLDLQVALAVGAVVVQQHFLDAPVLGGVRAHAAKATVHAAVGAAVVGLKLRNEILRQLGAAGILGLNGDGAERGDGDELEHDDVMRRRAAWDAENGLRDVPGLACLYIACIPTD